MSHTNQDVALEVRGGTTPSRVKTRLSKENLLPLNQLKAWRRMERMVEIESG